MTSPFASIGLAGRNDPDNVTAHRVSYNEQPTVDAAIQAISCLTVLVTLVNLDPTVRIDKGWKHEGECKSSLAQAPFALPTIPFKFHTLSPHVVQWTSRSMDHSL
jgi:hypothetical protein